MILRKQVEEVLRELPKTAYGAAMTEFLDEAKKELNDVGSVTSWEETIGRREAIKIINKLFSFLVEKKVEAGGKNQYT